MARILLVDDHPDQLAALKMLFERAGHAVAVAPNGRAAFMQVLEAPPDAILLDLAMPEMDGPSFLKVVRSYLRFQSLPVVVLTGLPDSEIVRRAQQFKIETVLIKGSASPQGILRAVEEASGGSPN